MVELRLSDEAASDLDEIKTSGIERFGPAAADRHLLGLRHGIASLTANPFLGQERPEFRQGIRSLSRRPHRILYSATDELVIVVRVLHHARDVNDALSGEA